MTSDALRPSKGEIQVRSEYFGPDVGKKEHRTTDRLAGPFKIGALLGRGITGSVRVGVHIDTGFQVALKCVKKKYLKEKEERWNTFRREMAVMKMMDHPHIIKLYDVFESSSRIYLVCEYVKGGELFDYISTNGLPKEEALRLFAQILLAIQHAHDYGIVHRDLKPENILLDEDKNIKIGDFGMARFIKNGILLHTSCGSPHYTSPEVIAGSYDGRISDVWSLGVIFYAMVSGCLPFNDENLSVMFELIQAGNFDIPPEVDPDCQDLIREMLQVDASKRIRIEDISNHRAFRGTSHFPTSFRSFSGLSPCASPGSISSCSSPLSSPGLDALISPKYAFASLKLPPSLSTTSLPASPMSSPRSVDSFRFEGKLDSGLIEDMLSLGTWESREEITARLQEPENNQEKGIYRLLSERKKSRLDELSRLSPRRVSRSLLPRISSVPSIHKSSSLATSSEYRETLLEFDLPPIRDDSPASSYTDSPRSVGRSPSPRTPRRIDLRVQIAKARKAKLDPESSPVVKQKQGSASASPRVSPPPKPESPKLFSHPLPEFITTDDIRSLQPYIQSHPSPTTTPSRKGSSGPMSDEVFAASLSQILKQLATTTHSSSPTQTKYVARAFFPKSGSREDDKKKTTSGSLKFKERQGELTPRPEDKEYSKEYSKDSNGRLSTSTSSRRSSTSSVDADSFQDSPTLPRRTLQPALDATTTTPPEKSGKRSTKLPPKKSADPSPTASPVPSGSSSPILQWFSSFFRRRPSLDPWAKVGGGVKDPASTRYQARAFAKNRSTFVPKPLSTPSSATSSASSLPPPPPPMSGITLLSPSSATDMVTSLSYEEKSDTVSLPTVHRAMSLPLDGTEKEKPRNLPTEETIKARTDFREEGRDRAKTSEHQPTTQKARHRQQRSGSLPMSNSIESEIKHRKRHSVQRTPRTPSAESSVPSSPSLQVPTKKSFFGRYRRLKPADLPPSPQSVTTPSVSTSTSLYSLTTPSPRTGASENNSGSVIVNFFKPKKTPTRKRNKSHEVLKKTKRDSLEDSSNLGYQLGTKSAPGSSLSTPQSSPALGPMCNPPDVSTLSISSTSSTSGGGMSPTLPKSGLQLDKNFDQDGDLVMF